MALRFLTVEEYVNYDQKEKVNWLIHGLLPKPSQVMLMGLAKEGKSFLALDIVRAVGNGHDLWGHKTNGKHRVVYIQADVSEMVWREMLAKQVADGVTFGDNVLIVHPLDQLRPLNIAEPRTRHYLQSVVQDAAPDLVVLDTYRKFHSMDENSSTEMKIVSDYTQEIFQHQALLIVHHTKKIPDDVQNPRPSSAARGSTAITGDMDALWLLYKSSLRTEPRWDESGFYRLARDENGGWSCPDREQREDELRKALEMCAEFPELTHFKIAQIAKGRHGWSKNKLYRLLQGRLCVHKRLPRPTEGSKLVAV